MTKFKSLERWVFVLTLVFMLCTIGWFFLQDGERDLTRIEVGTPVFEEAAEEPEAKDPAPGILEGEQLDINAAPAEELIRLPGIGQVKAFDIVAYREEHGPFQRIEEIMDVSGIGEKIFEKIAAYIVVNE